MDESQRPRCRVVTDEWCCLRFARRKKGGLCGGHENHLRAGKAFEPIAWQAHGGIPAQGTLPCKFPECANLRRLAGYCSGHAKQRRLGRPLTELRKWEPHPFLPGWGKAWVFEGSGYAYTSRQDTREKRLEHRVVMEHVIARSLYADENVHHINGDRADNRPENLELWSTMQPTGQRVEDKVAFALELLRRYRPEVLTE